MQLLDSVTVASGWNWVVSACTADHIKSGAAGLLRAYMRKSCMPGQRSPYVSFIRTV